MTHSKYHHNYRQTFDDKLEIGWDRRDSRSRRQSLRQDQQPHVQHGSRERHQYHQDWNGHEEHDDEVYD